MSKRKKKSTSGPDLPQAALERARKQSRGEEVEQDAVEEKPKAPEKKVERRVESRTTQGPTAASRRAAAPTTTRRPQQPASAQRRTSKEKTLSNAMIQDMLEHPTKYVSEEQLREEYGFVLADLRSMALLSATLFVVLVILAQFI